MSRLLCPLAHQRRARRKLAAFAMVGFILFAALVINGHAVSPAGALDPSFGIGGKTTTPFSNNRSEASAMLILPDGKILVAGGTVPLAPPGSPSSFALARYNSDGTLDLSFGTSGKVITTFPVRTASAFAIAVQPDGKIVLAGEVGFNVTSMDIGLARYHSNGNADFSFGTSGRVTTTISLGTNRIQSLAILPDGKILAGAYITSQTFKDFALLRYNTNGSLDTNFGTGGKILTDFHGEEDFVAKMVLQTDGKILLAGSVNAGSTSAANYNFGLARYNNDGSLDTSFDGDGKVTTEFLGRNDGLGGVKLQPDGKIVVAGVAVYDNLQNRYFALARYNSDGGLDQNFGVGGKVTTAFNFEGQATDLVIQPDGKIIVVGTVSDPTGNIPNDFALLRYHTNGSLDTSFGLDGKLTTDFNGGEDVIRAAALQPDGKLVVAGYAWRDSLIADFALARYFTTRRAALPSDFDGDGKSDLAVFRPTTGGWYVLQSSNSQLRAEAFGASTDRIVPADYDGDNKTDLAVSRAGTWYIMQSSNNAFRAQAFGITTDIPVPGDYDGEGKTDLAVFRDGNWYILQSFTNSLRVEQFGAAGDKPAQGDYDGDGKYDVAVFRPSNGAWYVLQSSDGAFQATQFGISSDRPVQGDYDGDGKTDFAVYRPDEGTWYVLQPTAGFRSEQFGTMTDTAVPADYDGDGRTDVAVYRNGTWYALQSSNGLLRVEQFGTSGDIPVPSAYVP